jgi:hypothetical protein
VIRKKEASITCLWSGALFLKTNQNFLKIVQNRDVNCYVTKYIDLELLAVLSHILTGRILLKFSEINKKRIILTLGKEISTI